MLLKLAVRNVQKSYRDYTIYFLTLTFSICMFYAFNSFEAQKAILEITTRESELLDTISALMEVLSVFVAIALSFLIIYANTFLLKRRKKELGIYMLEGIENRDISMMIVLEILMIGILSLITGITLGIIFSQFLTMFTSSLFAVPMQAFHFIFSMESFLMTILIFFVIFVIVMIFNVFIINRYQLIDLLQADKKNQDIHVKNVFVSVIIFVFAIVLLAFAYYKALEVPLSVMSMFQFFVIIIMGSVATILIFYSLTGFFLHFLQSQKSIYLSRLNLFSLRQLNNNINANFIAMSFVCLMLLMSIGALATGFSINKDINNDIASKAPVDISMQSANSSINAAYFMERLFDGPEEIAASYAYYDIVRTDAYSRLLLKDFIDEDMQIALYIDNMSSLPIVGKTQFLEYQKLLGNEMLEGDGVIITTLDPVLLAMLEKNIKEDNTITLGNKEYAIDALMHGTVGNVMDSNATYLIIPDEEIHSMVNQYYIDIQQSNMDPSLYPHNIYVESWIGINLKESMDIKMMNEDVQQRMDTYNEANESEEYVNVNILSRYDIQCASLSLTVIFTYAGIYLGVIFLISAGVLLALQQLSEAYDSTQRYQLLKKIGASDKMIRQSMFRQISLYFMLPLVLAIVHAIVAIQVVGTMVSIIREIDILKNAGLIAFIITLIYGLYFYITYIGYRKTVK